MGHTSTIKSMSTNYCTQPHTSNRLKGRVTIRSYIIPYLLTAPAKHLEL